MELEAWLHVYIVLTQEKCPLYLYDRRFGGFQSLDVINFALGRSTAQSSIPLPITVLTSSLLLSSV
jgi:hypothetical protein